MFVLQVHITKPTITHDQTLISIYSLLRKSNMNTHLFASKMCLSHSVSQSQVFLNRPGFKSTTQISVFMKPSLSPNLFTSKKTMVVVAAAGMAAKDRKGFVEEMRVVAMKLHTKDQAKEGEKETQGKPFHEWEPTIDGFLKFLVDNKVLYDTLEKIVDDAHFPEYDEFRNTGLERSESLAKDLAWFKEQGYSIPEPSSAGVDYSAYVEESSKKNPQTFICHFYNIYFAQSAGGRMIGKKISGKLLNGKELEFYKWDGDLAQLLQSVRDKLNTVAEGWSREERSHCLEETEISHQFSGEILRLIIS